MRLPDHLWRAAVVGAVLLALGLRTYGLASQSLWSDEDITLDRALLPASEMLAQLPVEHTPLYFLAMRGWVRLAGETDFALRFPSAVAGAVAVAAAATIGSILVGRGAGAVVALILAINPFLVWYGQDARMYASLSALGLMALAAALRARATGRLAWWVAAGTLTALCVYTHWYGALTALVLAAWALPDLVKPVYRHRLAHAQPSGHRDAGLRRVAPRTGWVVAGTTAAVLFAPWVGRVRGLFAFQGWREPVPIEQVPRLNLAVWTAGETADPKWLNAAEAVYLVLAAAGLVALLRRGAGTDRARVYRAVAHRVSAYRAIAFGLAPLAAGAAMIARQPDFHPRYFAAVVSALYLWAAAGTVSVPHRAVRLAAVAALAAVAVPSLARMYSDPRAQKQDYRAFVMVVEQAAGHEDTVLFLDGPSYGLTRRYEMDDSPVKIVNVKSSGNLARGPESLRAELAELAGLYPHLWLATNGEAVGDAGSWLALNARLLESRPFQDITLRRYVAVP